MSKGIKQIAWYAKKQNNPIRVIRISLQIIRHCCFIGEKALCGVIPWYIRVGIIYDTAIRKGVLSEAG